MLRARAATPSTISSYSGACTSRREPAVQRWPLSVKIWATAASIPPSASQSANTTTGDLPPSSTEQRLSVPAALAITVRPVVVSPVKQTSWTPACATSAAPAVSPKPCTTLNTPGGSSASASTSASLVAVSGDHSAGLSTTVLPAASAGAIRQVESISGAFQGMISPATPTGLCTV